MNDRQSDSKVTRRGFFQRAGVVAVTVSVPAWVWGCGSPEASEPANDATAGGEVPSDAADMSGALGERGAGPEVSDAQRAQIAAFEGESVFTATAPGPWEGKAGSHVPQVSFGPGRVELFTNHGMSPEHWIDAQYLKDQDGNVIAFAAHAGTDAEARANFTLPEGTTQITAYSHCNRHGDWSAEPSAPSV
ncbi:MAG: hypothetical protein GXP55_00380 [Deltaproteobacteria bacterium]|nr:hypothetical protein [Deltaproteobacteria bacterium]